MARNPRRVSAFGAMALAAAVVITTASAPASADPLTTDPLTAGPTDTYIVTLAEQPLATYDGGVAGIPATKPGKGKKVDIGSANAKRYRDHLKSRQDQVSRSVDATPAKQLSVASNAFVAELTMTQAARLNTTPGVLSVVPDRLRKALDDRRSTDFLGLSGESGLWSRLGGTANAGKGIVVGVIDTGIWPENPLFAAPALDATAPTDADPYRPYLQGSATVMKKADGGTFTGVCQTGEEFAANLCNQKLISARYFGDAWLKRVPPANRADYVSPRDAQGHGSHTASTAAGNADVPASVNGTDFGQISGVAPGAAIAVYKALWESADGRQTGGLDSDILAAVDQAVADGVDVINYSVGSEAESPAEDPIGLAFRAAAASGIFVATAGGNSGPGASTLDNTMPWTTTVAASTAAPYVGEVELGDGTRHRGSSTTVSDTFGPKPLATGPVVKNASVDDFEAQVCAPNSLDPARTAGKIVVCERGTVTRLEKSGEVKRAGGVGMIMVNMADEDTITDSHAVPTVHIGGPGVPAVLAYAATDGATAILRPVSAEGAVYPRVAGFSSRGPSLTNRGDLLKPDIAAPGVSILAAVAPPTNNGNDFGFYDGTSMATPHIAGLAALYLGKHPDLSPMAIKSAMMTTTAPTRNADGTDSTDAFAQGAGNVDPARMLEPGLVYDSTEQNWLGYLEGLGVRTGSGVAPIATSDLNYPSIALGGLAGPRTVTRTLTAVTPGKYKADIDLPGVKAKVSPSTLRFDRAGETKSFTVTMELKDEVATGITGSLTWTGEGRTVRSVVAVTAQGMLAPAEVRGKDANGSVSFEVTPVTKKTAITAYGLVSGPEIVGSVGPEEANGKQYTIDVPEGTKAVEFWARPDNGLELGFGGGVLYEGREFAGWVDRDGDDYRLVISRPKAGKYTFVLVSYLTAPGTTSTPFHAQANVVTDAPGVGGLTVSPRKLKGTPGVPETVTAGWSSLPDGRPHTGYIEYPNGVGTVISVN
ncbi:S8 family serine peptidase [Microtetraspora sp. AC03309]|uniref:S8 family serine peptidase n=1 Tax=Microtetraspora sp. AC03309 TaxID=2779376 RepID=UPI00272ECDEF|nr:S8 family serine peptidase [Microtetraspora sp. AC03309]MCC5575066.1 S8 family serine peptidase [Microtetraspora sp. AC03309]